MDDQIQSASANSEDESVEEPQIVPQPPSEAAKALWAEEAPRWIGHAISGLKHRLSGGTR